MMWIRSQNNEYLINTSYFEISGYANSPTFDIDAIVEEKWVTLGTYSTKGKAAKVLDMIVNYINSGGRMFVTEQHKTDFGMSVVYEKQLCVFQMPRDDEVEDDV